LAELGRFVSAVAHEVRNPLGVIAANVKLLERENANREVCDAIRGELRRASSFVDDLLRYGRPRPLELRMIDAAATLRLARSTAQSGASLDTADIAWEGEDAIDQTWIEADQGQLLQTLVAVIDNAILALQGAAVKRCRLGMVKATDHVQLEVEDSGPGLPREIAQQVFEPFVTGRKREGERSGTGLGLAIAKSIVERHQGEIAFATSTLGGARCIIRLPRVQALLAASPEGEP
jgi:signal transduction histidine kinase